MFKLTHFKSCPKCVQFNEIKQILNLNLDSKMIICQTFMLCFNDRKGVVLNLFVVLLDEN